VATLAFSPRAIRVHAERNRTMLPRHGFVSLAEAPANLETALPPSLAEALAADDSLADAQLTCVLLATAGACAEVSKALRVLSLAPASAQAAGGALNVQGETQKGMDVLANELFISALTGHVAAMASEEEEAVIGGAANRKYEVAFDPLDGSSNLVGLGLGLGLG